MPDSSRIRSLCVFCGSSPGEDPVFRAAAERVGRLLAEEGIRVVYGGGRVGLMGAVAEAALAAGGEVVGVIPRGLLAREVGHTALTALHVVDTMHERKARMAELSDGFIALPGGIGTLEELFEVWTWGMLGIHRKPYGVLDVEGFYLPLLAFLDTLVEQGFVRPEARSMLIAESSPVRLLDRLRAYSPPPVKRWLAPEES